jgi:orotate phosphoribosyltransferase
VAAHLYDTGRYRALKPVDGKSVLLIEDTWTTGANVQSAAHALKQAGARTVAAVPIGRHIDPTFRDHDEQLRRLPAFDWGVCAVEP